MAAAAFLALAHTLKPRRTHPRHADSGSTASRASARGLDDLVPWRRHRASPALLAWFAAAWCWQSSEFNDISQGNDATPLWIPQLGMALGALVFPSLS
jgi:hypothetical protein